MGTTSFGADEPKLSGYHPDVEKVREMEVVLSHYLPSFHRHAFRCMGNAADAEDVVQDALVSAYKHLGQFRGESRMSTWLTTIVINSARIHLRRRPRHLHESLEDHSEAEEHYSLLDRVPDRGISPEEAYRRSEYKRHLTRWVKKLPSKLRPAFQLCCMEGMTIREAAGILGVTESAVKSRVFRARTTVLDFARQTNIGHLSRLQQETQSKM